VVREWNAPNCPSARVTKNAPDPINRKPTAWISFGGGFFVQSLLVLWLYQAYGLPVATAASILFLSGLLSALSFLLAVPIATRFGLVNTMVFTHLPSNIFMILVPFAPNLATAIGLLPARSALSQMDVPTRSSSVMAVVTPSVRPAAASLTAVPRSFASALSPFLASYLLFRASAGLWRTDPGARALRRA
jgi:hypothetical protein